jgi:tight adherence protein B
MVVLQPIAIFFGAVAATGLALYGLWDAINNRARGIVGGYSALLTRADSSRAIDEYPALWLAATVVFWIALAVLLHLSLLMDLLLLPAAAIVVAALYVAALRFRIGARDRKFIEQLELALRVMASGLRSGLGMRQSLGIVVEEMPDPARYEFGRVIGQATLGASIHDALDDLAARIEAPETLMLARVMRVQSNAGGDLARLLEQLGNTIRDRRQMRRKVSALTSEGRASAIVLVALPIVVGAYISGTDAQLGHALLGTAFGHLALFVAAVLEIAGAFWLYRITQVKF